MNFRAGNPHLKPRQTQPFEVGYEYRQTPMLLLATVYYRENRNGVADVLKSLGDGIFLDEFDNLATSRATGLELTANRKITSTLSFALTTNLSWTQSDSLGPTFAPTRSLAAIGGQGNLTWNATKEDLFQLNAFVIPKRLTPQGYVDLLVGVDLGYRHKLSDKLSVVVTAQDIANSVFFRQTGDTPVLTERPRAPSTIARCA